jgi:hypothetical protein
MKHSRNETADDGFPPGKPPPAVLFASGLDADQAIAVFVKAGEGIEHVESLVEAHGTPFLCCACEADGVP